MADEDSGVTELHRAEFDEQESRVDSLTPLFGPAPNAYQAIWSQSRDHALAATPDANATGWLPLGPRNVGGAVRCLAQHPARPNELLAGSAQSGLWRSVDDGYSWRPTGGPALFGAICSVAYAPSDPRTVYVGTGELSYQYPAGFGFFRSTDGGETFRRLVDSSSGSPGSAGRYARIQVHPADASQAWIASDTGLWRLDGNTFHAEVLPAPAGGQQVTDVAVINNPGNPGQDIVLAGVATIGIVRGVHTRRTKTTVWTVIPTATFTSPPAGIRTVRVAWSSPPATPVAYAIMEEFQPGPPAGPNHQFPSRLFTGINLGTNWAAPGAAPPVEHEQGIAWYALSLAVNPRNPAHVVVGCVNVHSTINGGVGWNRILDWTRYDVIGDRAQHADQAAIVFDRGGARPNALWLANDGGISFSSDATVAAPVWRKRSYGITAAQLFDLTTHPTFAGIYGGGMQDNGTFVSYGGPTWYRLGGGDGGALGMHPGSPFRFYPTTQSSVSRVDVSQPPVAGPPPRNSVLLPDIAPPANVHVPVESLLNFARTDPNRHFFTRALACHPVTPDLVLFGGFNALQWANDGFNLATANIAGLAGNVTAVAFAPAGPDMWAGSDHGELFLNSAVLPSSRPVPPVPPPPLPATGPAWQARGILPGAITAIDVHPNNNNIVAVSLAMGAGGARGDVYLSHNRGANWTQVTGAAPNDLPVGSYLAVAFDPTNPRTLFVGTASGVYVARDLPAVPIAPATVSFNPTWRTFNAGLPLVPVTDLSISPITRTLRCATFGRGAFECSLTGVTPPAFALPPVSVLVRNHAADDGRAYPVAANELRIEPRVGVLPASGVPPLLAAAPNPPAGAIDVTHSPDIRIDSPRFVRSEAFAFGEPIDGAEFDEVLTRDEPLVGDTNIVYVQVQNRGTAKAERVAVHLYLADAGNPPSAPDIPADIGFPGLPPAGSVWQRADLIEVGEVTPGEPAVVAFRWIPPLSIRDNVALLAVVSNAADPLAALPAGPVAAFVRGDRHAALHITHVQRDTIFIRDGLDDTGERGAVAWGGRSPDIIVRQAQVPAANLAAEFLNRAASHADDRVRAGPNFIYVRVNNRTQTVIPNSTVRLFQIPRSALSTPGAPWNAVAPVAGVVINNIPAAGSGIAEFPFTPPADPDPDASAGSKGLIFLAMANVTDAAGVELDPFPDLGDITDVASFWRFFTGAPLASNAAMRALRFSA